MGITTVMVTGMMNLTSGIEKVQSLGVKEGREKVGKYALTVQKRFYECLLKLFNLILPYLFHLYTKIIPFNVDELFEKILRNATDYE